MATKKLREIEEIKKEIEEPKFDYIEKFATISDDKTIYIAEGTLEKIDEGYDIYYKIYCSKPLE